MNDDPAALEAVQRELVKIEGGLKSLETKMDDFQQEMRDGFARTNRHFDALDARMDRVISRADGINTRLDDMAAKRGKRPAS